MTKREFEETLFMCCGYRRLLDACSCTPQGAGAGVGVPPVPGNAGQQRFVHRPIVPVDNCHDRDPAACFEIFKYDAGDAQVPAENLVS
ncbi:unnamed protein product [Dracunculus medinensis]|uniref:Uncharacterized protein n=1 Tax=Dracunculus medinensis TaxID=318479 RepID=A0A0N4UR25_DRAME|nr:unnamed protein product [Dracunculus medinensis]